MYTSGSTGQPKAAVHTHMSDLVHALNSMQSHQLTAVDPLNFVCNGSDVADSVVKW